MKLYTNWVEIYDAHFSRTTFFAVLIRKGEFKTVSILEKAIVIFYDNGVTFG